MRPIHYVCCAAFMGVLGLGVGDVIPAYAQILTTNESPVIVDADQKVLGPVLGPVGYATSSLFYMDQFVVPVTVRKSEISGDFRAWFESSNCSGNPVIDAEEVTGIPFDAQMVTPATVFIPNQNNLGKVYVADPNNAPHTVTVQSVASDPNGCIENENFQAVVVSTIQMIDLDALFTPPFHVEVMTTSHGAQSYDLNGDGKADLLWRHRGNGAVAVWLMNGATVASTAFLGGVPSNWEIEQVADVNGDGKADVIWQNSNGTVAVWLMNGALIDSVGFPGGVSPEWKIQP